MTAMLFITRIKKLKSSGIIDTFNIFNAITAPSPPPGRLLKIGSAQHQSPANPKERLPFSRRYETIGQKTAGELRPEYQSVFYALVPKSGTPYECTVATFGPALIG
jgi:hypothetical protein